jgi:valyl-tRNA synthetase
VTEEIWQALPGERSFIMLEPFPEEQPAMIDQRAEEAAGLLMGVITGLRNIRSEMQIHPSAAISGLIICPDRDRARLIEEQAKTIMTLTRAETITVQQEAERPKGAASYIYTDIELFVPLAGLVDFDKESEKLAREKEKTETQLAKVEAKLGNEKFLANAPAEVVAKEQEKKEALAATLAKIAGNMKRLADLKG